MTSEWRSGRGGHNPHLTDRTGGSVDAVMGEAVGPYRNLG